MTDIAPLSFSEPHEEMITTDGEFPVGDGYVMLGFFPGGERFAFKAHGAERVDGIDYDAFKIYAVHVGAAAQWGRPWKEPWPAVHLFEKWDTPMDTVQPGLDITISLRNESDRPQRFAVKLVGKRLR